MTPMSSLSALREPGAFQAQLIGTWRVFLAGCIVQLVSGAICLNLGIFNDPFNSFWFGGAVASLPGFAVGYLWHRVASGDGTDTYKPILTLYTLCGTAMTVLAWPMAALQDIGR